MALGDFARRCEIAESTLSAYERGDRKPRSAVAKRIETATNGEVTASSLLGLYEAQKPKSRGVREDSAPFDHADKPGRKVLTVTVEVTLTAGQLEDYRKLLPDLEAIAAEGARAAMREAYLKAWSEANREAIDAHAKWIEKHGTFHDQFGEW